MLLHFVCLKDFKIFREYLPRLSWCKVARFFCITVKPRRDISICPRLKQFEKSFIRNSLLIVKVIGIFSR